VRYYDEWEADEDSKEEFAPKSNEVSGNSNSMSNSPPGKFHCSLIIYQIVHHFLNAIYHFFFFSSMPRSIKFCSRKPLSHVSHLHMLNDFSVMFNIFGM
jgi:hypothetical protein